MKRIIIFSHKTNDLKELGSETLFIADYENVKQSAFNWLATKLWPKKNTIL